MSFDSKQARTSRLQKLFSSRCSFALLELFYGLFSNNNNNNNNNNNMDIPDI